MSEQICTCHCGGSMFYRHLHAATCALSREGEEAPASAEQVLRDDTRRYLQQMNTTLVESNRQLKDRLKAADIRTQQDRDALIKRCHEDITVERTKVASLTESLASAEKLIKRLQDAAIRPPVIPKDETPESVRQWAYETFGTASFDTQLRRAQKEMRELEGAWVTNQSYATVADEAADVCICLFRIIANIDPDAINKKMAVNRSRSWIKRGDGTGHHAKQTPGSVRETQA